MLSFPSLRFTRDDKKVVSMEEQFFRENAFRFRSTLRVIFTWLLQFTVIFLTFVVLFMKHVDILNTKKRKQVIDDEEINLLLFEGYIKDLGMDVITFDNSKDGLEYLNQNGADLVYVDYMMPEMDGVELIKEFRKEHKTTPIIMVTSTRDDQALMLQALDAGATEFLLKPIRPFEFKI